jgi:serine/threonine protein kinase
MLTLNMERKHKYNKLNTQLSYLDDNELKSLVVANKSESNTSIIELEGHKIFCKNIKITELEYEHQFDTGNLFGLPSYYNYGIGSAGINCFRELLMHIKTTNWVLNDEIENFPLLYHYRIVKNMPEIKRDDEYINQKITYWNSSAVGEYLKAKRTSPWCILLFLEYIPLTVREWIDDSYQKNKLYLTQMIKIIRFLRKNGIIHFDTHTNNILVDNQTIYLSDFGLVYDYQFKTTTLERQFYDQNTYYDYGYIISELLGGVLHIFLKSIDIFKTKYDFKKKY